MTFPLDLLFLLVLMLAPGYTLHVAEEQPYPGVLGLACDRDLFGEVEGNAQGMCVEDKAIVLFPEALTSLPLAANIIAHEAAHFRLGVSEGETAYERFHEREAYTESCRFSYVPMCRGWLR